MIKLKRFDKPEWFELPGYEGVRLLIRAVPFQKVVNLLGGVKKKVVVDERVVDDYDEGEFSLKVFKEALVDFEGIEIEGPNEAGKLDKDKQKEIMFDYELFRDFVGEKAKELEERINKSIEGELKNFETSQSG